MSRKEKFIEWLLAQGGKSQKTAKRYAQRAALAARQYGAAQNKKIGDLYQIEDFNLISKIAQEFREGGKLYNKKQGNKRRGVACYAEFFADSFLGGESERKVKDIEKAASEVFEYEKDLETTVCAQISSLFPNYEIEGRQYPIQSKRIDILLRHKSKEELLVVELKLGKATRKVFGQISEYVGKLQKRPEFAGKEIRGEIIARTIDQGLIDACNTNPNITARTYRMTLELEDLDSPESEDEELD